MLCATRVVNDKVWRACAASFLLQPTTVCLHVVLWVSGYARMQLPRQPELFLFKPFRKCMKHSVWTLMQQTAGQLCFSGDVAQQQPEALPMRSVRLDPGLRILPVGCPWASWDYCLKRLLDLEHDGVHGLC